MKQIHLLAFFLLCLYTTNTFAQKNKKLDIIAYYTGDDKLIDDYEVSQIDQIIFSFCHLKEGKLNVDSAKDSTTIQHLVALKAKNPQLKIVLSLGGWGGCEPCSAAFSTAEGRFTFAKSVKQVSDYFKVDGLDLDWEYPTIEGLPGHLYQAVDKTNFTELIKILRSTLGKKYELSFAAGGFQKYLDESVEWKKIMPLVNRVNIMSYDLVNGYSKVTGHHTPLFSTNTKEESVDKAVSYLLKLGIPSEKLVIGGAFYTRTWKNVANINNGLYQAGEHVEGVNYKNFATTYTESNGWKYFWDDKAKAPYWYNESTKTFATGDDIRSVKAKTEYAKTKKLGGIMFWELTLDVTQNGLLNAIYEVKKQN
ncbi:glycoside hydrolase family 18 protein [Flavobacterium sp. Fl-77]|uniref:chitinase n=1 Tax=Flavobacterium flavipigmentatum TaxID=2893884 RepID=A0AAJ2SFL1_9FLAO|nr:MULTISPECIES: glycoside hydrolase family 18 protein [unclassified Flavobacterium]MDX6184003.1 glycoside hydrolase family 18 protein [Flavobacterium sp. Fl-33]MDX6187556.1 glycoside hydrolase family 18 protein [Flavobacterium sp. Fl-77]UFH38449.1 glycoside hydrolase family 18 protein [Flavobacterium sp. F-70]